MSVSASLHLLMRSAHRVRRAWWKVTGHRPAGVHGVVLTPSGRIVLVRLTYFPGWHLPGGGRRTRETPEQGLLRELREEIGLLAWDGLTLIEERYGDDGGRRGADSLFLVRGATYHPPRSLEIAEVRAFENAELPTDLQAWAKAALVRTRVLHTA